MNVLMVQASGKRGQLAPWVQRQVRALAELGVDTETFFYRDRRSLRGILSGGKGLRAAAKACGADLVHVHYGALQAFIAVLFSPVPVVVSYCGSDVMGNYDSAGTPTLSGRLSVLLSRLAGLRARRTLAKSDQLRNRLWGARVRQTCEVIPNGVDLSTFRWMPREEARAELGWGSEPVVLYMRRTGAWVKDPDLARATFEVVHQLMPTATLYEVENEPPDRMPFFLNAADVLLLTSRHEGSSNLVKEALACNLPVVSTNCGDTRDRLQGVRHSYVVEGRKPSDLAAHVVEILRAGVRSDGSAHLADLEDARIAARVKAFYDSALTTR